jgi:hypothetical protein
VPEFVGKGWGAEKQHGEYAAAARSDGGVLPAVKTYLRFNFTAGLQSLSNRD